jgi:hypothetical protein
LKNNTQAFLKRRNDPNAERVMQGISKVDGWAGSKTTQFKFPAFAMENYQNNSFVSRTELGLAKDNLTSTETEQEMLKKIPPGVELQKLANGYFYYDAKNDSLIKVGNIAKNNK